MIDEKLKRYVYPPIDYRIGAVELIDQTLLPSEEKILRIEELEGLLEAIVSLRVRGAPAIGIAAAYGMLLAAEKLALKNFSDVEYLFDRGEGVGEIPSITMDYDFFYSELEIARERLGKTRPTAVNLFWALEEMKKVYSKKAPLEEVLKGMAWRAFEIYDEELKVEFAIGQSGAELFSSGMNILTHCNAGGLATAGFGTALAVIFSAVNQGKKVHVYVDETRPLLQGARLTTWELKKRKIDYTLICDNFAPSLFKDGRIDAVIVGADRIASNGDTANKIGTLGLAVMCERFSVPFYVAAPLSTFDVSLHDGSEIPIEERAADEVVMIGGKEIAPAGSKVYNPAFDVTPHEMITAIITERGVVHSPDREKILKLFDL